MNLAGRVTNIFYIVPNLEIAFISDTIIKWSVYFNFIFALNFTFDMILERGIHLLYMYRQDFLTVRKIRKKSIDKNP